MKRKITSYKGGRSERIYARIAPEVKAALLARVEREGFNSFADWLEAQAMPHLTPLAQPTNGGLSESESLSKPAAISG